MNITIIISTKNRPDFILRQLQYYASSGFDGCLFIGDSSDDDEYYNNKKTIKKYCDTLKIRHFYNKDLSCDQMLGYLAGDVETDYLAFVPDDDLLLSSAIKSCIDFLDRNLEYSAAHGKGLLIEIDGGKVFGSIVGFSGYNLAVSESDTHLERIEEYFKNVANINMSVVRRSVYIDAYKEINQLSYYHSKFIFGEIIPAIVYCSRGKIKQLDDYYLIRQAHEEQNYRKLDFHKLITTEGWLHAYNMFKQTLLSEMKTFCQDIPDDIDNRVEVLLENYFYGVYTSILCKKNNGGGFKYNLKNNLKRIAILRSLTNYYGRIKIKREINSILSKDSDSLKDIVIYIDVIQERIPF